MRGDSLDLLVSHRAARPYQSSPGKAHSRYLEMVLQAPLDPEFPFLSLFYSANPKKQGKE